MLSEFVLARQRSMIVPGALARKTGSPRTLFTPKGKVLLLPHREAQKLIQLILRDFIMSWYRKVSADEELPKNVCRILEHIALELNLRIQKIDIDRLIVDIVALIDPYLMAVNDVGCVNERGQLRFDINHPYCLMLFEKKPDVCHPALRREGGEIDHVRRLVDTFVQCAVPAEYLDCDPARLFVREVLVSKIFLPLVSLLCDPDFLMRSIPLILKKASNETVQKALAEIHRENTLLEDDLAQPGGLLSSILATSSTSFSVEEEEVDTTDESFGAAATYTSDVYQSVVYRRSPAISSRVRACSLPAKPPPLTICRTSPSRLEHSASPLEESPDHTELIGLPAVYVTRHVRLEQKDGVHTGYIIKVRCTTLRMDEGDVTNTCTLCVPSCSKNSDMMAQSDMAGGGGGGHETLVCTCMWWGGVTPSLGCY